MMERMHFRSENGLHSESGAGTGNAEFGIIHISQRYRVGEPEFRSIINPDVIGKNIKECFECIYIINGGNKSITQRRGVVDFSAGSLKEKEK
jgi:hypothetical protein